MSRLTPLTNIDDDIFSNLLNNEILVYEDVQGSKLYVNYDGEKFNYRPKSLGSVNLNIIDLAIQKYYNSAISFFDNLDVRQKALLNNNWWFCFEYFPDNQPANIEYNKLPKNNLVLTAIVKNNKYAYTVDELIEFSNLINCDILPYIFMGKLSEDQIKIIKYFLNVSANDIEYVFDNKNFAFFFYKMLNPSSASSYLMDEDIFNDNLQKIIIKSKNNTFSFEILNPLYQKVNDTNSTDYVDIYSLILINFMNYVQLLNLDVVKITGEKKEELYICLVCKLFNLYMNDSKSDLDNFDIIIPDFFNKEKFKINKDLITNKITLNCIENPKYEYIFKIILGSLNKKLKKEIGLLIGGGLNLFNAFVDKINNKIDTYMNMASEEELVKRGLMDFSDFYSIKYDTDSAGEVYPNVYKEFDNTDNFTSGDKKKDLGKK
jgi:hypothetical protein